jgi:hypothetical protein
MDLIEPTIVYPPEHPKRAAMDADLVTYLEARRLRRNAIVCWIIAAAIAVGGGVMFLHASGADERERDRRTSEITRTLHGD